MWNVLCCNSLGADRQDGVTACETETELQQNNPKKLHPQEAGTDKRQGQTGGGEEQVKEGWRDGPIAGREEWLRDMVERWNGWTEKA